MRPNSIRLTLAVALLLLVLTPVFGQELYIHKFPELSSRLGARNKAVSDFDGNIY